MHSQLERHLQAFGQRAKDQDAANKIKRKGEPAALLCIQNLINNHQLQAIVLAALVLDKAMRQLN